MAEEAENLRVLADQALHDILRCLSKAVHQTNDGCRLLSAFASEKPAGPDKAFRAPKQPRQAQCGSGSWSFWLTALAVERQNAAARRLDARSAFVDYPDFPTVEKPMQAELVDARPWRRTVKAEQVNQRSNRALRRSHRSSG